MVEQSQIKSILADLCNKPSLLEVNATPPEHGKGGSEIATSTLIVCNTYLVNCAPAASISVFMDETLMYVVLFEVLNADGTRGYVTAYVHDKNEKSGLNSIRTVNVNPTGFLNFIIVESTISLAHYSSEYPTALKVMQLEGYVDYVEAIYQPGIIPQDSEDMILSVGING